MKDTLVRITNNIHFQDEKEPSFLPTLRETGCIKVTSSTPVEDKNSQKPRGEPADVCLKFPNGFVMRTSIGNFLKEQSFIHLTNFKELPDILPTGLSGCHIIFNDDHVLKIGRTDDTKLKVLDEKEKIRKMISLGWNGRISVLPYENQDSTIAVLKLPRIDDPKFGTNLLTSLHSGKISVHNFTVQATSIIDYLGKEFYSLSEKPSPVKPEININEELIHLLNVGIKRIEANNFYVAPEIKFSDLLENKFIFISKGARVKLGNFSEILRDGIDYIKHLPKVPRKITYGDLHLGNIGMHNGTIAPFDFNHVSFQGDPCKDVGNWLLWQEQLFLTNPEFSNHRILGGFISDGQNLIIDNHYSEQFELPEKARNLLINHFSSAIDIESNLLDIRAKAFAWAKTVRIMAKYAKLHPQSTPNYLCALCKTFVDFKEAVNSNSNI